MELQEAYGWISSMLFSFCGLPQAIQCIRTGHSEGINWLFLLMWLGGEVFAVLYILPKQDMPLLVNYFINAIFLFIMIFYKIFPRIK